MKYEIIHLSDLHIKNQFDYEQFANKIYDSILFKDSKYFFSKIILCVTGDISKSGKKEQFDFFDKFLVKLSNKLCEANKELEVVLVPGNHDIKLSLEGKDKRSQVIRKAIDDGKVEELLSEDIDSMKCFFDFSRKYNCFENSNFVSSKVISANNEHLTFNMINTACFSTLGKQDKDIHFIPKDELNKFFPIDGDVITLMHHSYEWFDESVSDKILELCEESIFYLYGHQHRDDVSITKRGIGFISNEILPHDFFKSHFNIYVFDSNNRTIEPYIVRFNKYENKFVREKQEIINVKRQKVIRNSDQKYKDEFGKIIVDNDEYAFESLFVVPIMTLRNDDETINTMDLLANILEGKKLVSLLCNTGNGKTTMIKAIFNYYLNKEKTILVLNDSHLITNNFEQSLKNVFAKNYQFKTYDSFVQEGKEEKIILVDNLDYSDNKIINFLKQCEDVFNIVVITDSNAIIDRNKLVAEGDLLDFEKIKIEGFSFKQRYELITNFSKIFDSSNKVDVINKLVESLMIEETFVDLTSPEKLAVLVQKIIKDKLYEERDTKDAFSIIFESSILNKIVDNIEQSKVDDAYTVLREIAFYMFSKPLNECYKISASEIVSVIKKCKEEWGVDIESAKFLNFLEKSKFMKQEVDEYYFNGNSYYSFLIAKSLIIKYNNGEDVNECIKKLIENICFGNYSDILLFIAYFRNSYSFFSRVIDELTNLTYGWLSLSYDKNDHYILRRIKKEGFNHKESYENKTDYDKRIDSQERKLIIEKENENKEKKYNNIAENEEINQILKAAKMLEILSKGAGGYKSIINLNQRQKMIDLIWVTCYKMIYKVFDFTKEEYNSLYEDINQKIREKYEEKGKIYDEEKINTLITNALYDMLSTFTLNILSGYARVFATKNSIKLIDKISDYDENDKLIFDNFLFKAICYERYSDEQKFVTYILENYPKIENIDQKRMINRIINLYLITNNVKHTNIDKISVVTEINKQKLLLLNQNNRSYVERLNRAIKI